MTNAFGTFDGLTVTSKRVVFRTTTVGASDHSIYADDLATLLAGWIPADNIQIISMGGRFEGKVPFEKKTALIEDRGHPRDRFTNESNLESHLFRIYLSYNDLRRQNRVNEIQDLNEAIARYIDKNLADFTPDGHQDAFASTVDTESRTRGGFKNNDGIIDVELRQEV